MIEEMMRLIDSDSRLFWEGTRSNRLFIQHCPSCDRFQFYPRIVCSYCMSDVNWVEASGEGTVYSFTVVQRAFHPFFADKVPYVVALVELTEGPRLMTHLVHCDVKDIKIGMKVRATFEEQFGEYKLVQFIPQ